MAIDRLVGTMALVVAIGMVGAVLISGHHRDPAVARPEQLVREILVIVVRRRRPIGEPARNGLAKNRHHEVTLRHGEMAAGHFALAFQPVAVKALHARRTEIDIHPVRPSHPKRQPRPHRPGQMQRGTFRQGIDHLRCQHCRLQLLRNGCHGPAKGQQQKTNEPHDAFPSGSSRAPPDPSTGRGILSCAGTAGGAASRCAGARPGPPDRDRAVRSGWKGARKPP